MAVSFWMIASGSTNVCAEARVEPVGKVAGELDVLALVFADRHDLRVVQQDVGGLSTG